jgi:hypothetical protein
MIFSPNADDFVAVSFAHASAGYEVTKPRIELEPPDRGAEISLPHTFGGVLKLGVRRPIQQVGPLAKIRYVLIATKFCTAQK